MITAIEIENFKGFGERQRVELAPITLLFGQNSAGKSSFFRALFLLRNLLLDWREKQGLGRFHANYDMGDFRDYVHNHDMTRSVRLRVELNTGIDSWIGDSVPIANGEFMTGERSLQIEFGISGATGKKPWCSEFSLSADGRQMLEMHREPSKDRGDIVMTSNLENLREWLVGLDQVESTGLNKSSIEASSLQGLPVQFAVNLTDEDLGIEADSDLTEAEITNFRADNETRIREVYEAGLQYLFKCLETMIYIGPLREIPRETKWDQQVEEALSWDEGLAAWQSLSSRHSDTTFIQANKWLQRLQMNVLLEKHEGLIRVRPAGLDESVDGMRIQDVGTGISQVVPLIAALCEPYDKVVLFEQPELHLNPRVQIELGDLLIETCVSETDPKTQAVIETHSEHIIHRIKRRVRETAKATAPLNPRLSAHEVAIYYFGVSCSGCTNVQRVHLDVNAEFVEPWPDDFFDLDFKERFA